jgi:transcriptional regulatory protein RtcR
VQEDFATVSPETHVRLHTVPLDSPWDFESVYASLYAFAREYSFDIDKEDYLVHITTGTHVAQICLFLLTESRHLPARLLQSAPPKRRSDGGPGEYAIIDLDLGRYEQILQRFQVERVEAMDLLKSGIPTRNAAFNKQVEDIEHVALASKDSILLMGPTGAGKSQLARRIFELKRHRHQLEGSFVEVNCATIRGDAAMSTLFGHKKGAFTGAVQDRPGLLRAAHGGVLFLDEVGELGLVEQAMLLRALEERTFLPVGSDHEARSEFQLIAGTNRDLRQDVVQGRFRDDLLARIDLWTFYLPSLRERLEDLEPNLGYELDLYAATSGRRVTFQREAREKYLQLATADDALWSGNFRDLNSSVRRMAVMARSGRISLKVVEEEWHRLSKAWHRPEPGDASEAVLAEVFSVEELAELDRFDRVQLADVITVCRSAKSLSAAGRQLYSRSRLRKKSGNDADRLRKYLNRFALSFDGLRSSP